MKIQFSPGRIRVRVDRAGFQRLRDGECLSLALPAGWVVRVEAGTRLAASGGDGGLVLVFPAPELDALARRLPAREGIGGRVECAGDACELALEVDVRDAGPRRAR